MSDKELDQARLIAERIARRLGTTPTTPASPQADIAGELAAMRATLGELQNRLVQIESKVSSHRTSTNNQTTQTTPAPPRTYSPWLAGVNDTFSHPSLERFGVEEAVVSELVDFFQGEKNCSVEPGGKPCDHCAMCSSRGF